MGWQNGVDLVQLNFGRVSFPFVLIAELRKEKLTFIELGGVRFIFSEVAVKCTSLGAHF